MDEAPVPAPDRIVAVDVLRGFALLGILVMNVVAYALPDAAYVNPLAAGGFRGADRAAWWASHLFFELKMMTIFSALFGAGLVLQAGRLEQRGGPVRRVYFRRLGFLLVIGALHAYLVWWGDILVTYAQCGFVVYLFRRCRPRTLIVTGLLLALGSVGTSAAFGAYLGHLRSAAEEARVAQAAGRVVGAEQAEALEEWEETRRRMAPNADEVRAESAAHRSTWAAIARHRAPNVLFMQTLAFLAFLVWRVGGTMLVGMGLMKLGVFSAARSDRFYAVCMLAGYGLGLPLVAAGAVGLVRNAFDVVYVMRVGNVGNAIGSFLVALGHVGLVMACVRRGVLAGLQRRLAAVGQMALTNYMAHSLVLTTVFYGYGFNLFGQLGRAQLLGIVAAMWAAQLAWSPWWLSRFRFGPAEWAWRSATYGTAQPMRLAGPRAA